MLMPHLGPWSMKLCQVLSFPMASGLRRGLLGQPVRVERAGMKVAPS
jgi:hypothetical protein